VIVQDSLAYLSVGPNKVHVVNIANPTTPQLMSTIQTRPRGGAVVGLNPDMALRDSLLFIATDSSVTIVNVQNPIAPQIISDFQITRIKGIALARHLALLARNSPETTQSDGLHILDVSNPYNPTEISRFGDWAGASVMASGNYAFVAALTRYTRAFVVIDLTVPEQPYEIARLVRAISGSGFPMLAAANDRMYWVPSNTYLVDVANPVTAFIRDSLNIGGIPSVLSGSAADTLFMSAFGSGVYIYRYDILTPVSRSENTYPKEVTLENNFPNPFNSQTAILYTVPVTMHIEITVYNILGEKVITLVNGCHRPGNYRVVWDGTNSQGNVVSTGVYFSRLTTTQGTITRKLVLIK